MKIDHGVRRIVPRHYYAQPTPAICGLRIFALTFLFLALVMNIQSHGWIPWYRLAETGRPIRAEIISLQPENHGGCKFSYTVGFKTLEASSGGCKGKVGQSIEAVYLPSDPSFVTLKNPLVELALEIGGALFLSIAAGSHVALKSKKDRIADLENDKV